MAECRWRTIKGNRVCLTHPEKDHPAHQAPTTPTRPSAQEQLRRYHPDDFRKGHVPAHLIRRAEAERRREIAAKSKADEELRKAPGTVWVLNRSGGKGGPVQTRPFASRAEAEAWVEANRRYYPATAILDHSPSTVERDRLSRTGRV